MVFSRRFRSMTSAKVGSLSSTDVSCCIADQLVYYREPRGRAFNCREGLSAMKFAQPCWPSPRLTCADWPQLERRRCPARPWMQSLLHTFHHHFVLISSHPSLSAQATSRRCACVIMTPCQVPLRSRDFASGRERFLGRCQVSEGDVTGHAIVKKPCCLDQASFLPRSSRPARSCHGRASRNSPAIENGPNRPQRIGSRPGQYLSP